eukprot:TRINITY_DN3089_c0_g1_i10.p1 TRINITY_DN3089_c0_g1~~TRINITY_DN3089_c0_g1_i10.p1  ORF type:complete len:256 (-),score=32.61 TRINITY_DN3089_c0_g1_i10:365-1132(-)
MEAASSVFESVRTQYNNLGDTVQQAANYVTDSVQYATNKVTDLISEKVKATALELGSAARVAENQREKLQSEAQVIVDTGVAHFQNTEEVVFDQLKACIKWWVYHPAVCYTVIGVSSIFILPVTRRMILYKSSQMFTTEETRLQTAAGKLTQLVKRTEGQVLEGQKLQERVALASEEFLRGKRKLRGSSFELRALLGRVETSQKQLQSVLEDLRELPRSRSLALRARAADNLRLLQNQKYALSNKVEDIINKGVW